MCAARVRPDRPERLVRHDAACASGCTFFFLMQGQWDSPQLRFNGPECLQKCTKYEQTNFSLTWDDTVAVNPEAKIIGYVAMVQTENKTEDPRDNIPDEFREYLNVMSKEAAHALPEHKSYDCRIELKEGEKAPWRPI